MALGFALGRGAGQGLALALGLTSMIAAPPRVLADEGMWPLHQVPREAWQAQHGFAPSDEWLTGIQRAAVRLSDGGSASLVSAEGLILTNHHVARSQIHKLSTPTRDFIRDGFYAKTRAEELLCPDLEARVLWSTEDVTAKVQAAVKPGATPQAAQTQRKAAIAELERQASADSGLLSEVVTLFGGGQYFLYRYKRYPDVRLVFAPEEQAAAFGGEYDNFTYPRHALDFAILRVYENGQPLRPQHFLRLTDKPATEGEFVLALGHPGTTSRGLTVTQLKFHRDVMNPLQLGILDARHDALMRYAEFGDEPRRQANAQLRGIDNQRKRLVGQQAGLQSAAGFAKKQQEEAALRTKVTQTPALRAAYGDAWTQLDTAYRALPAYSKRLAYSTFAPSRLTTLAQLLLRYPVELAKPSAERLEEFRDPRLPSLRMQLRSAAPIPTELEEIVLMDWLVQVEKALGPRDPFVMAVLAGDPPALAAHKAVVRSTVGDAKQRKLWMDLLEKSPPEGAALLAHSTDPLLQLVRRADPVLRELRLWHEQKIQSVETIAAEKLAKARFAVYGSKVYPDATFTLRITAGEVRGYEHDTRLVPYQTLFYGLFDRALSFASKPPYQLAPHIAQGRLRIDPATPLNFVYSGDTIGGNSGSPVLNRAGEVVGLNFDSNLEKLPNRYFYVDDAAGSRAVAVHSVAIVAALQHLYGAAPLASELLGRPAATTAPAAPTVAAPAPTAAAPATGSPPRPTTPATPPR